MRVGKLYGIGVGPGDPELVTLKAARIMRGCGVIAVPHKDKNRCLALRIALGAVPELINRELLEVDMPMTKDPAALEAAYAAGAEKLRAALDTGSDVGFLTLGDPTVYSTYAYLHRRVAAMGFETEIIPGITSFCAAAAALGEPLCEGDEEVHIVPGAYRPEAALSYPGVKVFMKNDLPRTLAAVKSRGLRAMMVENCGLEGQRLCHRAEEIPENAGYYTVMIVGETEK